MSKIYLIVGEKDTDFENMTFAACTSEKSAELALEKTCDNLGCKKEDGDLKITHMEADTITVDDQAIYVGDVSDNNTDDVKQLIDNLSYIKQDDAYRYLWAQHVRQDVIAHAADIDVELDEGEIDIITERYVYEGDYDCNFSYWQNIENLIDDVTRSR